MRLKAIVLLMDRSSIVLLMKLNLIADCVLKKKKEKICYFGFLLLVLQWSGVVKLRKKTLKQKTEF